MLYVVATPIGNLEDITLRAIKTLNLVSLILAEDTRRTRKLLQRYSIDTPLKSYHDFNKERVTPKILRQLSSGTVIALVCDSGTPGVSDPGYYLIRRAWECGIKVSPVPGASSVITAISISGLPTDRFAFEGFLPAGKTEREKRIVELGRERRTLILFETPGRLTRTLNSLRKVFPESEVAVFRELTKIHEEVIRGKIDEVIDTMGSRSLKGEIVVVLNPGISTISRMKKSLTLEEAETVRKKFQTLTVRRGVPPRDALKRIVEETGIPRNLLYPLLMKK
jgi:16S rRNA (cytidine1402-2'-O)-methyltransferase